MKLKGILNERTVIGDQSIEELMNMMDAARRGLGVANKLRDPISKKRALSQVMANLNVIRGGINRWMKANGAEG